MPKGNGHSPQRVDYSRRVEGGSVQPGHGEVGSERADMVRDGGGHQPPVSQVLDIPADVVGGGALVSEAGTDTERDILFDSRFPVGARPWSVGVDLPGRRLGSQVG